jgi:peptidylprolyl isomerase
MTSDHPDDTPTSEPGDNSVESATIGSDGGETSTGLGERAVAIDADDDAYAEATAVATPAGGRNRALMIIAGVLAAALVVGGFVFMFTRDDSSAKSSDPAGSTVPTLPTKSKKLSDVTVEGAFGEAPTITFKPAYVGSEESFRVISEGDGPVVEDGQRVMLNYLAVSGADGSELDSTFGGAPQPIIASKTSLTEVLADALVGQRVGTRVLVAADQTESQPGAWVLFAFDILSAETLPTSAVGTPQDPLPGFPIVTVENGVPKIATPTGTAPTELRTEVLIKGNGPAVTSGQTVTMQYTGIIWATGTEFDSSWGGDPVDFPIGSGQVIPGFDEGLIGQTVGSRVVIIIPPDKGYGPTGNTQAGISGTDTLVFVVDILAAS